MNTSYRFFQLAEFSTGKCYETLQELTHVGLEMIRLITAGDESHDQLKAARGRVNLKEYFAAGNDESQWSDSVHFPPKVRAQEQNRVDFFTAGLHAQDACKALDKGALSLRCALRRARLAMHEHFQQAAEHELVLKSQNEGRDSEYYAHAMSTVRPRVEANIVTGQLILQQGVALLQTLTKAYQPVMSSRRGRRSLANRYRFTRTDFAVCEATPELIDRLSQTLEQSLLEPELLQTANRWTGPILVRSLTYDQAIEQSRKLRREGAQMVVVDYEYGRVYDERSRFSGDMRRQGIDHDSGSISGGEFPDQPVE